MVAGALGCGLQVGVAINWQHVEFCPDVRFYILIISMPRSSFKKIFY